LRVAKPIAQQALDEILADARRGQLRSPLRPSGGAAAGVERQPAQDDNLARSLWAQSAQLVGLPADARA
jgi:hypothetical protein